VLTAMGEDGCQFLGWDHFELGVGAVAGLFVLSPSAELRHVTEAAALHVLVPNFYYEFGPHWFPGHILALTPAALRTGHALIDAHSGFSRLSSVFRPGFPRMSDECVFTIGLQKFCEFEALRRTKARTNSNVLQSTGIVVKAQQQ